MQRKFSTSRRGKRGTKKVNPQKDRFSPPEFVSTLSIGHKFRFVDVVGLLLGNPALSVTRGMLLNLYSMATTTTNQNRLITAIKLKRVQVWGVVAGIGSAPSTISVEWVGNQAPSTLHSDVSTGVRCGYISTKPPQDSSDRWWSISGVNESEVLFKIFTLVNSIVDITVSIRFADDEAAVSAENGTGAASTVGKVYFNYLDGFASKHYQASGGVTVLP